MFRFEPSNFDNDVHVSSSTFALTEQKKSTVSVIINATLSRALDILLSLFALIMLSPLFVVVAILISRGSKGGIFYRQTRSGFNGTTFEILKFRSMRSDGDSQFVQCVSNDPRVTSIGGFLRKTSIDELPQLWNILKGDMAIVGPRPHAVEHDAQFAKLLPHYFKRYSVKPGLTGLAQIKGFRGPTPSVKSMGNRLAADLEYAQQKSFVGDLKIIAQTMPLVISAHNAH
jgi:putative colanic acid biosysnthesis UDP-glucose lipid carrier transferase